MAAKIQQLGEILQIEAILAELQEIGELILIPHRDLHRFPLEFLFPEDLVITRLPSAQVGLNLLGAFGKSEKGEAFGIEDIGSSKDYRSNASPLLVEDPHHAGSPPLLAAELESAVIGRMFADATSIPGEQAGKEQLKTALAGRHRYFHFTGHGTYEFQNPKLSALLLKGKERLTVEDICELDLTGCEIASISACEIAITGNQTITTEYVGLASALMAVGVANVVSPLWSAESVSSALMMMEFYRLVVREEVPPALALKRSQLWLQGATYGDLAEWYRLRAAEIADSNPSWEDELERLANRAEKKAAKMGENYSPYSHPYYWAGFTIAALPSR